MEHVAVALFSFAEHFVTLAGEDFVDKEQTLLRPNTKILILLPFQFYLL
jgi:hypothetical protein